MNEVLRDMKVVLNQAILLKGALSDLNSSFLAEDSEEAEMIAACSHSAASLVERLKRFDESVRKEFENSIKEPPLPQKASSADNSDEIDGDRSSNEEGTLVE